MGDFFFSEHCEEMTVDLEAPAPTPTDTMQRTSKKLPVKRRNNSLPDATRPPFEEIDETPNNDQYGDIYFELPPLNHSVNAENFHDTLQFYQGTQFEEIVDGLDGYYMDHSDDESHDESDDVSSVPDEQSNGDVHGADMEEVERSVRRNVDEIGTHVSGLTHKSFECNEECVSYPEPEKWEDQLQLAVGKQWGTMDACRKYIRIYAIKNKFEVLFQKNCSDKIILRCKGEGCPWRCYIIRRNDGHTAEVKTLREEHTCENDGSNINRGATARWIANMIAEDMTLHHKSYTPRDIIAIAWNRWTININYWKAWHARVLALERVHGNYEKSYCQVPELCRQIQASNPGSLVEWKFDTERKFKYLCVAFRSSLDGWIKGCRPLVGLDGCFLKGKYRGVCLAAISMDGNNGMFPLAMFVCRKEDGQNWDKFLELIAPELKKHSFPLTVISDRAQAISSSIETHLEGCNPRSCFRHIFKNMSKWWKGEHIKQLAWATASAFKKVHFEKNLLNLENAAVGTKEYLMGIGPHLWSRAHFDTICKSDHLTNNFTESYNSFILSEREKPVCSMIIGMSFLMMKIMYARKTESNTWNDNGVVPRVAKVLALYKEKQNDFVTHPSGEGTFCVMKFTGQHWTVNLNNHECECCEWQVTGIPCVHAVHLISHLRLPLTQYCSPFLSVRAYKSAYESNIKPISHESDWPEGNEVVLPPILSRAPGRPKRNRLKGHDENETQSKNMNKCSKCLSFGHNKRSCQGGPVRGGANTSTTARGGGRAAERGRGRGRGRVAGRGAERVARRGGGRGGGRSGGRVASWV